MKDSRIEFACNMGLLLDKQAFDCVVADAHAENLFGSLACFVGCVGKLDATGLSALANRHLRLDDTGSDIRCSHCRLGSGGAKHAAQYRNARRPQDERLRRVFLKIHYALSECAQFARH